MASLVDSSQISKAVDALIRHVEVANKKQLWEEGDIFSIGFSLRKAIEKKKTKPIPIELPHSYLGEKPEICLFVKDPKAESKKLLEEKNVQVSKVIPLSKLKKNYLAFEDKKKLSGSYDLFLSDSRILHRLPNALGKAFFKKKRQPIAIDFDRDIGKQIKEAIQSTGLFLSGSHCSVRIANTNMSREHIIENIVQTIPEIVKKIPENWDNIQSIHLKGSNSMALPIFAQLPEIPTVDPSTTEETKKLESKKEPKLIEEKKDKVEKAPKQKKRAAPSSDNNNINNNNNTKNTKTPAKGKSQPKRNKKAKTETK